MTHFLKSTITIAALLLTVISYTPNANAEGLRIRGEIKKLKNNLASIETTSGQKIEVILEPDYKVLLYKDIRFEDIPKNAYLSIPSIPAGKNKRRALGINIFPEAMRGFNEGLGDWDLTSDSKMTNATLAQVVNSSTKDGRELVVSFGAEKQQVIVPQHTQITTFGPVDNYEIKKGHNVVIFAQVAGGKLAGKFVGVHENGELPPI
ncbi:hypothetical protein EYS14_05095 [Alteromonadaceae bacterium M269]|nr:hypothetical protein EYS14_05095 [Alteromonadaceae bacterium M269]